MKIYKRTEDGTTTIVTQKDGMAEINHAMMDGQRDVREMASISRTDFDIDYKDGRHVGLVLVDAEEMDQPADEPREWHGTHSKFHHLHRFTDDDRARCNRRIHANVTPPDGGKGSWGVFKYTRSEIETGKYAHLYTFCPRCSALED